MSFFPIVLGKIQEGLEADSGTTVDQLTDYFEFNENGTFTGYSSDFQDKVL